MAIKSFKEQLVALFNSKNSTLPQPLTVADVEFGAAAAYEPADGEDTRNTALTITAVEGNANFTGAKELHYSRIAAAVVGAKAVTDDQADWDTDEEVLTFLNLDVITAGKAEDEFTLAELTITRTDGADGAKVIEVAINDGHIKYLPGVLATYTVTQEVTQSDLSASDGELDGFTA